jgi:hypothetical protein
MQKALSDSQRAASLAPGDAEYQLQVANILQRLGRDEDARKTAAAVQSSSSDPKTADKAGNLIAQMSQPKTPVPSAPASKTPANSTSNGTLRIENKTDPNEARTPAVTPAAPTAPTSVPTPSIVSESHTYSMVGTITDVTCANSPQVQITLKAQTIVMKLHADDLGKVAIKSAGSSSLTKNAACASLRGRNARVSYFLVPDKTWDGEMQAVEFR